MEIRARYFTIGLFTLAIIAAGFIFVYWLYNAGGIGPRTTYRVRFQGSVGGLSAGSPVTFNGLRVGEVTGVGLDPADPSGVIVTTGIVPSTPIRADTKVAMDYQGLTGTPVVALSGGTPAGQPLGLNGGEVPILAADPEASRSMTDSARTVMQRLDTVLNQNAEPLNSTLTNLKTFTDALSRNSSRVDGILAGLERMTGGAGKSGNAQAVDLSAASGFKPLAHTPAGQLAVAEPTTIGALDTDKLVLDPSAPPDKGAAQWADVLPKLVQVRLVESFENAGLVGSVLRGSDQTTADYVLQTDIRKFRIVSAPAPAAEIEIGAKVLSDKGRILAGKIITKSVPITGGDAKAAGSGLNEAFGGAATELVAWAVGVLDAQPPPKPSDAAPAQ